MKQKYVDHFLLLEAIYDSSQEDSREIETLREKLNQTIQQLPQRCQEIVRLRIDEELSNAEIAERVGVKKDTVGRYMTQALEFFKEKHPPIYKDKPLLTIEAQESEHPYANNMIEGLT